MPYIIEDEKRLATLKKIEQNLASVQQLNEAMDTIKSHPPTLVYQTEKGKTNKLELTGDNEIAAITGLLSKRKTDLVKQIRRDAGNFDICLTDADEALLSMPQKQSKKKADTAAQ